MLESRLLGEISKPQICRLCHPMAESEEELKSLLMKVKEESKKLGFKPNIHKNLRSWHLVSSPHDKEKGKRVEAVTFYFLGFQKHFGQGLQP